MNTALRPDSKRPRASGGEVLTSDNLNERVAEAAQAAMPEGTTKAAADEGKPPTFRGSNLRPGSTINKTGAPDNYDAHWAGAGGWNYRRKDGKVYATNPKGKEFAVTDEAMLEAIETERKGALMEVGGEGRGSARSAKPAPAPAAAAPSRSPGITSGAGYAHLGDEKPPGVYERLMTGDWGGKDGAEPPVEEEEEDTRPKAGAPTMRFSPTHRGYYQQDPGAEGRSLWEQLMPQEDGGGFDDWQAGSGFPSAAPAAPAPAAKTEAKPSARSPGTWQGKNR